eukprot:3809945-Prymnesium_polylepis.1
MVRAVRRWSLLAQLQAILEKSRSPSGYIAFCRMRIPYVRTTHATSPYRCILAGVACPVA